MWLAPRHTRFPYTTLFRSRRGQQCQAPYTMWVAQRERKCDEATERMPDAVDRLRLPDGIEPLIEDAGVVLRASQTLQDRKSTRLNSSHVENSYAVFCLKKK